MKSPLKSVDYTFGYLALAILGGVYFAEAYPVSSSFFLWAIAIVGLCPWGLHELLNRFWIEHKGLRILFGLLLGIFCFCGGAWKYQSRLPENQARHYTRFLNPNFNRLLLQPAERWKPTAFGERFVARVLVANNEAVTGKLLLIVPANDSMRLSTDSLYAYYGEVQMPAKARNPYQFDYRKYLNRKFIHHQVIFENGEGMTVGAVPQSIMLQLTRWRASAQKLIQKHFPDPDVSAIMQALLIGQRQEVSPELNTLYVNAGAVHLLAVSGLHVGVVAMLLYFLIYPLLYLKRGRLLRYLLTLLLLWIFAGVAGFSPSVTRAVFMFTIIGLALLSGRGMHGLSATFLSAFLLLLYDPSFAFEVGFQLSYMAVIGIFVIKPFFDQWRMPKNRILHFYWNLFAVSMAAQLAVSPLSLYYFHQFPGLFALSSLALIPLLGLILGGGLAVLFALSLGWHPQWLTEGYAGLIGSMNAFIGWVAQKETFLFTDIPFDMGLFWSFYLVLFFWIVYGYRNNRKNLALLLLCLLIFQSIIIFQSYIDKKQEAFWVFYQNRRSVVGIQQGNSIRIYTDSTLNQLLPLQSFITGERLQKVTYLPMKRIYNFGDKIFMVLNHHFLQEIEEKPYGLIISHNPEVNPRRALKKLKPKIIIVDGSNYRSTAEDWEKEAAKLQIPFHNTYTSGYYRWPFSDN